MGVKDELLGAIAVEWRTLQYALDEIPDSALEVVPRGYMHTPKDVLGHLAAYERWIAERVEAALNGETTALPVDRQGYREYNEEVWREAAAVPQAEARERAEAAHAEMVEAVSRLSDEDLISVTPVSAKIDHAYLGGRNLIEVLMSDTVDHYREHMALFRAGLR